MDRSAKHISPVKLQRFIAFFAFILLIAKLIAWWLTHSVAILTDALESIVNVVTGFFGLYAVILAARPRDYNHPYGHSKVEYISSFIEGTLISIAGIAIIVQSVNNLIHVKPLHKLDIGIILSLVTGVANYLVGAYAVKNGKKHQSMTLQAAGKHLQVDSYSTFAIVIGLLLLLFTQWYWIDAIVALLFAVFITVEGARLIRRSLAGIMDEVDEKLLNSVINCLQSNRKDQWIDLHNLRVIQYGRVLHLDAHMTLPWYYQVKDADKEIHDLEHLIHRNFSNQIELFVHIDACKSFQCKLCAVKDCAVRQEAFQHQVSWTEKNLWANTRHGKNEEPGS